MSDTEAAAYSVPPVERALRLLKHIGGGDPAINVSRTAATLGINRTTLIRLLHTLESERFIERRPDGVGWRLGLGAFTLAAEALTGNELVGVGTEILRGLTERLSLSTHLAVLDGAFIVYLVKHTPNTDLVSNIRVGSRLPAYATNMGRIMLAHLPEADVRALFQAEPLLPMTAQTPTTVDALLLQLDRDREAGLAWSENYFETGISSVAASVFDGSGRCTGAVNVTGPPAMFAEDEREGIAQSLRQAAAGISARLGFISKDRSKPWSASTSYAA